MLHSPSQQRQRQRLKTPAQNPKHPPPGARPIHRTQSAESYSSLTMAIKAMTRFGASSNANIQAAAMQHSASTQRLYAGGWGFDKQLFRGGVS